MYGVMAAWRIEREFDPSAVRAMKAAAADPSIGGPKLAGRALAAGPVDEVRLFLPPVRRGRAGNPALPRGLRPDLEPLAERRFGNGVVHVGYAVRR